jgi:hypothetical protein
MHLTYLFLLIGILGGATWLALIGIPLHFLGRYLRKHYSREWQQLGSPDLATAQGARRDRVWEWLRTSRYRRLNDEFLNRWVPLLQKLPVRGAVVIVTLAIAAAVAAVLAL